MSLYSPQSHSECDMMVWEPDQVTWLYPQHEVISVTPLKRMLQLVWAFENVTARRLYRFKITGSAYEQYNKDTHECLLTELDSYRASSSTIQGTGDEGHEIKKLKAELLAQVELEKDYLNMWRKALGYRPENANEFDDGPLKTVADVRWQFHRRFKSRWRRLQQDMVAKCRFDGTRHIFLTPDDQRHVERAKDQIDSQMAIALDSRIDDLSKAKLKELLSGVELALVKALKRRSTNDQKLWENAYNACYEERLVVEKPQPLDIERERGRGAY